MNPCTEKFFYEKRPQTQWGLSVWSSHDISFPPHLHTELELFLVTSGRFLVGAGEQSRMLAAGDFAVLFPNTIHSYRCEEEGSEYMMLICQPSLAGDGTERLTHMIPANPFLESHQVHEDIRYAMNRLYQQSRSQSGREVCRALVQLILAHCFSALELVPLKEIKSVDLTRRLIEYLSENYKCPLTLDMLSKELGVSKYYISHIFSKRLSIRFPEYINFLRVNDASVLLCLSLIHI